MPEKHHVVEIEGGRTIALHPAKSVTHRFATLRLTGKHQGGVKECNNPVTFFRFRVRTTRRTGVHYDDERHGSTIVLSPYHRCSLCADFSFRRRFRFHQSALHPEADADAVGTVRATLREDKSELIISARNLTPSQMFDVEVDGIIEAHSPRTHAAAPRSGFAHGPAGTTHFSISIHVERRSGSSIIKQPFFKESSPGPARTMEPSSRSALNFHAKTQLPDPAQT
jgi:hypothetical protein